MEKRTGTSRMYLLYITIPIVLYTIFYSVQHGIPAELQNSDDDIFDDVGISKSTIKPVRTHVRFFIYTAIDVYVFERSHERM